MRTRHKPYARPELSAWPYSIDEPETLRGTWQQSFCNPDKPLRLELGCGKGGFLADIALREPAYNYLGVDIKSEMLVVAKRTIEQRFADKQLAVDNVLITSYNIEKIPAMLCAQDQVQRIYINFCNPWYKSGYAKHRLTHPRQLLLYRQFLMSEGAIYFKTDDDPLFVDSLRYFALAGFEVVWQQMDLHNPEPAWNVQTEHEKMFSDQGIPIKACIALKKETSLDEAAIARMKTV